MDTQHTEQPPVPEHDENQALRFNIQADVAVHDIDSLFIAALCVIRMDDTYSDMSEDDKKQALETLMEYGRGAVVDAQEGIAGVWKATRRCLYKESEPATPDEFA